MPVYQTPGVYYERVDAGAPAIPAVRVDVAGFVGIAGRGPVNTAVPVQSWRQFAAYFGEFIGAGYLAYTVRAFFENGGRRCWVVRVASDAATTASAALQSAGNRDVWRLRAFSPGVWGNDLEIRVHETHRSQTNSRPRASAPESFEVDSIAGFLRGTHVRISQQGSPAVWAVVSDVDAVEQRLVWLHPKPEYRLPYDRAITGFDSDRPVVVESVEYTIVVRERGRLRAVYQELSLVPEHPRYGPHVLAPVSMRVDAPGTPTLPSAPEPIVLEELRNVDALAWDGVEPLGAIVARRALAGGADGLSPMRVVDFIGEEASPRDGAEVRARKRRGLRVLEEIAEVAILAVPDIHVQPLDVPQIAPLPPCIPDPCLPGAPPEAAAPRPPAVGDLPPSFSDREVYQVQAAMVDQCERLRYRIAVLDPPRAASRNDRHGVAAVRAWRNRFESTRAALYYPWLRVVDPLRPPSGLTRDIPPSGHVVGQFARTDFSAGVHKAPANFPVEWAQDVTATVDADVHGVLNPEGINAIRAVPGRGIRIAGARTVSSDPDWRFLNVRRLLIMIEKSIDLSTQWAAFEPNEHLTRAKLRMSLTSFLLALWQQGSLAGASAAQAFYVKCDEENNPARERDLGRLSADVGVAPSIPFEFVVLRVGRTNNEFEITEPAGSGRGV